MPQAKLSIAGLGIFRCTTINIPNNRVPSIYAKEILELVFNVTPELEVLLMEVPNEGYFLWAKNGRKNGWFSNLKQVAISANLTYFLQNHKKSVKECQYHATEDYQVMYPQFA